MVIFLYFFHSSLSEVTMFGPKSSQYLISSDRLEKPSMIGCDLLRTKVEGIQSNGLGVDILFGGGVCDKY